MVTRVDGMKRNESFVFYLQHNDESSSPISLSDPNAFRPNGGEQEIARACKMVIYYPPFSDNRTGILGTLYCTTLRIVFVPATGVDVEASEFRTSRVFSSFKYETSLLNISHVQYASGPDAKKLKPLTSFLQHPDQVVLVKIYCKDFRIFTFDFKSSEGYRALLNALIRYAFPLKLTNVVSVYRQLSLSRNHQMSPASNDDVPNFDSLAHWESELRRTGGVNFAWRVTHVNVGRRYVEGYPEYFVVPTRWLDSLISESCSNWTQRRIPVWCWSSLEGCALVRSSTLNTISEVTEKQWKEVENSIAVAHPNKLAPVLVDTNISVHEVAAAFEALRKLCSADTGASYWHTDTRWLSEVELTGWSSLVVKCLSITEQVVNLISRARRTVILRESGNADIACVISSLVQLCLDSYYRTFGGFAVLLQKEWIALSHPFALRLFGLASESRSDEGIAPVFLLFLDCVSQLLQQHPCSFAMSSHYLVALWDLSLTGLTRTFLFNNLRDSSNFKGHAMPSAWCLDSYFTPAYRQLFTNSLFAFTRGLQPLADCEISTSTTTGYGRSFSVDDRVRFRPRDNERTNYEMMKSREISAGTVLLPNSSLAAYRFWDLCYLRWSTPAQILHGGQVQIDLQVSNILAEISQQLNELRYLRELHDQERTKYGGQLRQYRINPTNLSDGAIDRITSAFPFGWETMAIPDYSYILPLRNEKQPGSPVPRSDLELATCNLSPQAAAISSERLSVWGGSENGSNYGIEDAGEAIKEWKLSRRKNKSVKEDKSTDVNNKVQEKGISTNLLGRSRKLCADTIV